MKVNLEADPSPAELPDDTLALVQPHETLKQRTQVSCA